MQPNAFDFICVGSGPAGQKAAIQAAKAGYRAAIIEREPQVGRLVPAVGHHSQQGAARTSAALPPHAAAAHRRWRSSCEAMRLCPRLLHGVDIVIAAQDRYLQAQLASATAWS